MHSFSVRPFALAGTLTLVLTTWPAGPTRAQYEPVPPGYVPPYPYGYRESQVGGYLRGTADIINAQGQSFKDVQSAALQREQVRQAKTDTQRKAFDEWLYERANTPTPEEERQRKLQLHYQRMRHDPPTGDIWSGAALNVILNDIQKGQGTPSGAATMIMDPSLLRRIGVTDGRSQGGIVVLTSDARLRWPLALTAPAFASDRKKIDELIPKAVSQGKAGPVEPEYIGALSAAVANMRAQLKSSLDSLTANDAITARRFLNQLDDAIKTLSDPNVSNYLTGKWAARGETAADVAAYLTHEGLQFAPAIMGAESAYTSLYQALKTLDTQQARLETP
jgi:hypothetical protein